MFWILRFYPLSHFEISPALTDTPSTSLPSWSGSHTVMSKLYCVCGKFQHVCDPSTPHKFQPTILPLYVNFSLQSSIPHNLSTILPLPVNFSLLSFRSLYISAINLSLKPFYSRYISVYIPYTPCKLQSTILPLPINFSLQSFHSPHTSERLSTLSSYITTRWKYC
jgi:hypothetical protein